MEVFSKRLKWLREKSGYTQKEMAEKLGITQSYYSKFEYGQREPNLETLVLLPRILGEGLDFLLGVTDFTNEIVNSINKSKIFSSELTARIMRIKQGFDYINSNKDKENIVQMIDLHDQLVDSTTNNLALLFNTLGDIRNKIDSIPEVSENTITELQIQLESTKETLEQLRLMKYKY